MAIALYVPPQYGPTSGQQGQNQGQGSAQHQQEHAAGSAEAPVIVDVHHEHFQAPPGNHNYNQNETPSLDNTSRAGRGQSRNRPAPLNQGNALLPDVILPSIFSEADNSIGATRPTDPIQAANSNQLQVPAIPPYFNDRPGPLPLSPRSNQVSIFSDFIEVEVKVEMCLSSGSDDNQENHDDEEEPELPFDFEDLNTEAKHRVIGTQLRLIANQLDKKSTSQQSRSFSSFQVNVSIAVPAIAFIGLGLVYLNRR